jgi:predicted nucleic acid-binding protein
LASHQEWVVEGCHSDLLALAAKVEHQSIAEITYSSDPKDDMVLELAVAASASIIITHNIRDFDRAREFGVNVFRPGEFLRQIGEIT